LYPSFEELVKKGVTNYACKQLLREIGDERKMCYQILAMGQLYAKVDQFYFDVFVD
jgi:hypothetical protein